MTSPTPEQIRAARIAVDLTQAHAAELIYSTRRTWQDWEAGVAKMHAGLWELFCIKTSVKPEIVELSNRTISARAWSEAYLLA